MTKSVIKVGGVPEHFNMPWHIAMEQNQFKKRGVDISWTNFRGGTGQMTKALRDGDIDICVLLTEGIITDIINGNPSRIISEYVKTPLIWGIHTGAENPLKYYKNIYNKRYAISRFGSGSHLMAIVDANDQDVVLKNDQFVVIKNLDGALESLEKHETDVFYWEKYTTKPFVVSGQLRRVGEYKTPWPCFVIAAREEILNTRPDDVIRILRTIHDSADLFMQNDSIVHSVSERYGLDIMDASAWYHTTEWAIHGWVSDKMMRSVIYHLRQAGIIPPEQKVPELIWKR